MGVFLGGIGGSAWVFADGGGEGTDEAQGGESHEGDEVGTDSIVECAGYEGAETVEDPGNHDADSGGGAKGFASEELGEYNGNGYEGSAESETKQEQAGIREGLVFHEIKSRHADAFQYQRDSRDGLRGYAVPQHACEASTDAEPAHHAHDGGNSA